MHFSLCSKNIIQKVTINYWIFSRTEGGRTKSKKQLFFNQSIFSLLEINKFHGKH